MYSSFFFNTSFNLKQSQEVCAEPVVLLVWKCVVNSSVAVGTSMGSAHVISTDEVKSKPCTEVRGGDLYRNWRPNVRLTYEPWTGSAGSSILTCWKNITCCYLNKSNRENCCPDGECLTMPLFEYLPQKVSTNAHLCKSHQFVSLLCDDSQGHFQRHSKTYADVTSLCDEPT